MKSQKQLNLKKEMKTKNFQNLKISELNQCQCQTMSVSGNVKIYVMSESHNVRI